MEAKGNYILNNTIMMHLFKEVEALEKNFQFLPGLFSALGKFHPHETGTSAPK